MNRLHRPAWILIAAADLGLLAWGAGAALVPDHLLGPKSVPILAAGYEGFTGLSWSELTASLPKAAEFMNVLFRVYGAFNVAFALIALSVAATAFRRGDAWAWWALLVGNTLAYGAAMTYDQLVGAIGPFELMEYVGLAAVYAALAIQHPRFTLARPPAATGGQHTGGR